MEAAKTLETNLGLMCWVVAINREWIGNRVVGCLWIKPFQAKILQPSESTMEVDS